MDKIIFWEWLEYKDSVLNYSLFEFYEFYYLPSFFLLYPILFNFIVYSISTIAAILISIYLFYKYYGFGLGVYIIILLIGTLSVIGNAGFLIVPAVIYILNNKDKPRATCILAFICFIPSVFVLALYMFIKTEDKKRFLGVFIPSLILFNLHFLINPYDFILFFETGIEKFVIGERPFNCFKLLIRPFSFVLVFHILYNKLNLKYKYNMYLKR